MINRVSSKFRQWLAESRKPILSDGAMGTLLNAHGIDFKECFDVVNIQNPMLVAQIHRDYIEAGADVIQTNTFGANRYKLSTFSLQDDIDRINREGVRIAKQVVEQADREVLIAGDIGPLGIRLAPYGRIKPIQARQAFKEQMIVLVEAGIDLLILETFSDLRELLEAIAAAREVCDLPCVASMSFTRDDRTILGETPILVAQSLWDAGADVIGVNCSGGPEQVYRVLSQMKDAVPQAHLSAMPNAGFPQKVGGRVIYPASPTYFGDFTLAFRSLGASLIGGCCGTTPAHIAAMRRSLDEKVKEVESSYFFVSTAEAIEKLPASHFPSQLAEKLDQGRFVVAVEMHPPRGLSTHKLIAGAEVLTEAGVDVINVADTPMARMRMSAWAVCHLIQQELNVETTLHFPTRGRNLLRLQGDLLAAYALGIRNIFVVMGDPTRIGDYPDATDHYDLLPSGVIKLIKHQFNVGVDHAGVDIGQPTSFFVGCALNLNAPEMKREINNLHRKIKAGADFIITQPVFHPRLVKKFVQQYGDMYGELRTPLLVGIVPLFSYRHALYLHNEVPGVMITEEIFSRLKNLRGDASVEGINIALETIEQMKPWIDGVYLIPAFNRYDVAAEIIEDLKKC